MCITQGQVVIILCNHPSGVKKMGFFYKCHQRLESLPDNVKGEKSKVNFKGSLKTHLFNDAKSRHMNEYVRGTI